MNAQLAIWLPYWRLWMAYLRYSVVGLEHLDGPRAKMVAGYHARGIAWDMCMINIALYDRLHYMPHSMLHRAVHFVPFWHWLADGLGFFISDGPDLAAAVARGEHVIITPGGADEGCRRWDESYKVNWRSTGYLKLAIKYDMPVVPVGAAGGDGTYFGLNTGPAFGRWLGLPPDLAYLAWTGIGPLGLYPYSPPWPVRLFQIVGEPIDPRAEGVTSVRDKDGIRRLHERITARVQSLIDEARDRVRKGQLQ